MKLQQFDSAYLDALRAGDEATVRHFVDYFTQLLVIKLRARRCPADVIDDVCQETFSRALAALRRDDGIREPEKFGAYVNTVCNYVYSERCRDDRRLTQLDAETIEAPDEVVDFDALLVSEQARRRVRKVLEHLSTRDRDLLEAVFFEERDRDQLCRDFGVDREYLRVLLHRAKQHFRAVYIGAGAGETAAGRQR